MAAGPIASPVETALARAEVVRRPLAEMPSRDRAAVLRIVAANIHGEAEALAELIVREGVKTIREARAEVERAAQTFLVAAEEAGRFAGAPIDFGRTTAGSGRWGQWERRPIGIVAAVTPYNDPLNLVAHKIAPAIACGTPVIVKPHEATPTPARRLEAFVALTTLPEGAVQVVEGGPDTVRNLVGDARVRLVSFTGGAAAGRAIAAAAGPKKLALELGGIGTSYVHADANLDRAAARLASGIVWAGGQNCVHTQHVLVHADAADPLSDRLATRLDAMICGDRMNDLTDVARQVDRAAAARIEAQIEDALAAGARALVRVRCADPETVGPCLLTDVPDRHPIATQEIFGPVAVLTRVTGVDDALTRTRRLGPSLNASIFTDSLSAIRAWDWGVDAGAVIVNDSTDFRVDHMPFGGNGAAGIGREGVASAMDAMTEAHVIVLSA